MFCSVSEMFWSCLNYVLVVPRLCGDLVLFWCCFRCVLRCVCHAFVMSLSCYGDVLVMFGGVLVVFR